MGSLNLRNLIAVLIVFLTLALMVTCAGCKTTTYAFERTEDPTTGSVTTRGEVKTVRQFKSMKFVYNPETGAIELSGEGIETQFSPIEYAAAEAIRANASLRPTVPE